MGRGRLTSLFQVVLGAATVALVVSVLPAGASTSGAPKAPRRTTTTVSTSAAAGTPSFSTGQLQASTVGATGCGTNIDGEPAIHVSRANTLLLGSEEGVGSGSDAWRRLNTAGGPGGSACGLEYRGQPNVVAPGLGASGGDIDLAFGSARNSAGTYTMYV